MKERKIKEDNAYLVEVQNNFKLIHQIQKYEDQSLTTQMFAEYKHNIWYIIKENITELWPSI